MSHNVDLPCLSALSGKHVHYPIICGGLKGIEARLEVEELVAPAAELQARHAVARHPHAVALNGVLVV